MSQQDVRQPSPKQSLPKPTHGVSEERHVTPPKVETKPIAARQASPKRFGSRRKAGIKQVNDKPKLPGLLGLLQKNKVNAIKSTPSTHDDEYFSSDSNQELKSPAAQSVASSLSA